MRRRVIESRKSYDAYTAVRANGCSPLHTHIAEFFEHIALFVLLVGLLLFTMPGCASTRMTVTGGSDNATIMAAAGEADDGLDFADLVKYAGMAEQEAVAAWQLYESTKDTTAAQKVVYWTQYADGVADRVSAKQGKTVKGEE